MNSSNTLFIKEDVIKMKDFRKLKPKVTFCFLPGGVVIINGEAENRPFRFEASIDDNGNIYNKQIVEKLYQRGIVTCDEFFSHENCFYETTPHRIQ